MSGVNTVNAQVPKNLTTIQLKKYINLSTHDQTHHPGTVIGSAQCPVLELKTVFLGHAPSRGSPVLKQEKNCWQFNGFGSLSWFPKRNVLRKQFHSSFVKIENRKYLLFRLVSRTFKT